MPPFLNVPFTVRLLGPSDFDAICALRQLVLLTLSDPDLYAREADEPSFLDRNLTNPERGQTVGVFTGQSLIAYGIVSYPTIEDVHNLGQWISLSPAQLNSCAVMESAMVHPDHRCCGWQKLLLRMRARLAAERGKQIYTAVAPLINWVSRHNLFGAGYVIAGCAEVYPRLQRHIFAHGLYHIHRNGTSPTSIEVDPLDFEKQYMLTRDRYVATTEQEINGARQLLYEKVS